jgi:ferredoxin-NADP reductase
MFSISSAPAEEYISITTNVRLNNPSKFKQALKELEPKDTCTIRGPVGPMHIKDYSKKYVFIANGLGITPIRSIIAQASIANKNLNAHLVYKTSSEDY